MNASEPDDAPPPPDVEAAKRMIDLLIRELRPSYPFTAHLLAMALLSLDE